MRALTLGGWSLTLGALWLLGASGCVAEGEASSARGPVIRGVDGAGQDLFERPPSRPPAPQGPSFLGLPEDELLETLRTKAVLGARPTAGSSLSLRLNLEGEVDAAYKPHTSKGQRWYGEIAAYRIARLLGVGRVPPATTLRLRVPVVEGILDDNPEALARFREEAVVTDNEVLGAAMYWVPTIHIAEVDRLEELHQWTGWLRQGASIPPDRLSLAQQVSETIVFDYLTGNWDRWSSHNVLFGPEKRVLLMMDNNAAFNTHFSEKLRVRLEAPLGQVERFSATLYRRLIGLRVEDIRAELAEDGAGVELLSEEQITAVLRRRDELVARIDRLSARYGHDAVLCFP